MIAATFEVAEHAEHGSLGLRMVNRPHFDPLPGMACAHDMLEHPVRDNGTLEHELMALGASLWVRDETNYYCQRGQHQTNPATNIASDMVTQFYLHGDGYVLSEPPRTRRLSEFDWAHDLMESTLRKSRLLLLDELDERPAWLYGECSDRFVGWMRHGFNAVRRRFRGNSAAELCHTFMEIERKADRFLDGAIEGQRCRITVDVRRCSVQLDEVPDPYDY